ncbi:hypothetical protein [Gordonia jinghuaiqii]|nr:hypothetical protein [Gordonia jinghuaiqii]
MTARTVALTALREDAKTIIGDVVYATMPPSTHAIDRAHEY